MLDQNSMDKSKIKVLIRKKYCRRVIVNISLWSGFCHRKIIKYVAFLKNNYHRYIFCLWNQVQAKTNMDSFMSLQITNLKKLHETMITYKTFLSSNDSFMSLQIANLKNLLVTMITCNTFFSSMDSFMSL